MLPLREGEALMRAGKIGSTILGGLAAIFLLLGLAIPLLLQEDVAESRQYLQQFQAAERFIIAHVAENGRLPDNLQLQSWAESEGLEADASWVATAPIHCDNDFERAADDRFVLGLWRGEWNECYSSPSGKTTLALSVRAYLASGLGYHLASYWLLAILLGWVAWWLRRRDARRHHREA